MSKHIPQVPGQFTEGDEGLPEFWQKEFATSKEVAAAMKLLDITSIQTCPKCRQMWVNLNDEKCRKCGASMVHVVKNKPAATVHRMESGEATFCKNCGKPIVEDTSGRGWRHGETGPYVCSETYAQPGGTPPASPTVTETFAAKEACRIVNKFPQIEQMVMAPMLKMEIALALLRAAETKL